MSGKKKETVPNSSVGADAEQPLNKANKSIITKEHQNLQVTKCPEKSGRVKNVQISEELFIALVKYHLIGMREVLQDITKELEKKMDSLVKHQLYSQYKTAFSEEERKKARNEYLDRVGLHHDFRW